MNGMNMLSVSGYHALRDNPLVVPPQSGWKEKRVGFGLDNWIKIISEIRYLW